MPAPVPPQYEPVLPQYERLARAEAAVRRRAWIGFAIGTLLGAAIAGSILDNMQIRAPWRFGRVEVSVLAASVAGVPSGFLTPRWPKALAIGAAAAVCGLWLAYLGERMSVQLVVSGDYREDTLGDLWYFLLIGLPFGLFGALPGAGVHARKVKP